MCCNFVMAFEVLINEDERRDAQHRKFSCCAFVIHAQRNLTMLLLLLSTQNENCWVKAASIAAESLSISVAVAMRAMC